MSALVQAISRISRTATSADITWKVVVVFCLAGLLLSLMLASNGFDLTPGFSAP